MTTTLDFDKDVIRLICTGKKDLALENFKALLQEQPDDTISRLLQDPQVSGITPKTILLELALTVENLAKLANPTEILTSRALANVLRTVAYDQRTGTPAEAMVDAERAYKILDAMVAAGARLDVTSAEGGIYDLNRLSAAKREKLQTQITIPAPDEKLDSPDQAKNYVDKLVDLDSAIIGNNLDRIKGTRYKRSNAFDMAM